MRDEFVLAALERFTPAADDVQLDWQDVLERASSGLAAAGHSNGKSSWAVGAPARPERGRRWLSRRLVVSVAMLVVAGLIAVTPAGPAIARALGDFSGWLSGQPGKPASRAEQRAFEQATRSWLAFPRGVVLRRLIRTRVGGVGFSLDGYRVGDELCLRLVATGVASASTSSCVPLSELRARRQPALVVLVDQAVGTLGRRRVRVGPSIYPVLRATVTAGIVADGVRAVETAGDGGGQGKALLASDSFLAIVDRPPVTYRTRRVWATTQSGRRVPVPFAPQELYGASPYRPLMTRKLRALGPAGVQRHVRGGSIGWLSHHESRGAPVPRNTQVRFETYGHPLTFERLIAPDPNSPLKLVVAFAPWGPWACEAVVLGSQSGGGCSLIDDLFTRQPLTASLLRFIGSDEYNIHYGFATDAVARITAFLADGKRIAVPLRDNVYAVQIPRSGYPARLVGYDQQGRVIAVSTWPSLGKPRTGRTPVAHAHWRTVVRVTSDGTVARLMIAPEANGGSCYSLVFFNRGDGNVTCPPRAWSGPPLQLGFNDLLQGTFFSGSVRPGISKIQLHLPDGRAITATPIKGQVLIAIPNRYARRHNGSYIVAFDRHEHEVARDRPEN